MIKMAIVSDSKKSLDKIIDTLPDYFEVRKREDNLRDGMHSTVISLDDVIEKEIVRMLEIIETATGVNPVKFYKKDKRSMKAKRAASYILRNRFGLSFQKIADIFDCNHATILMQLKGINLNVDVNKNLPIELAVAVVLRCLK